MVLVPGTGPWCWSLALVPVAGLWHWSLALVPWLLRFFGGPLVLVVVHFLQFSNLDYTITTALIAVYAVKVKIFYLFNINDVGG